MTKITNLFDFMPQNLHRNNRFFNDYSLEQDIVQKVLENLEVSKKREMHSIIHNINILT